MEGWTLGDIIGWLGLTAGAITSIGIIYKVVASAFHRALDGANKPIIEKLEALEQKHDLSDREHAKNYIVRFLADVEQGEPIDKDELHCFWDNYTLYQNMGGNSYIHEKVERLKAKGKL